MRSPSPPPPAAHFTCRPLAIQSGVRGHPPVVVRPAPRRQRRGYPRRTGTACPTPSAKTTHPRPPTFCITSVQIPPRPLLSSADCCPHNKNNVYFNAVAFLFHAFAASRNNIFSKILAGCVSVFDSYSSNNRITMSSCPGMASKSSIDKMLPSY